MVSKAWAPFPYIIPFSFYFVNNLYGVVHIQYMHVRHTLFGQSWLISVVRTMRYSTEWHLYYLMLLCSSYSTIYHCSPLIFGRIISKLFGHSRGNQHCIHTYVVWQLTEFTRTLTFTAQKRWMKLVQFMVSSCICLEFRLLWFSNFFLHFCSWIVIRK